MLLRTVGSLWWLVAWLRGQNVDDIFGHRQPKSSSVKGSDCEHGQRSARRQRGMMPRQRSPHPSASVAPAGVASGDDGYTCGERTSLWLLSCVDKSVKVIEPILIILAIGLISLDVYTFFKFVIPEVGTGQGRVGGRGVGW